MSGVPTLQVFHEINAEVQRADADHPGGYHSAHEALGVILEEVHEFQAHVFAKQRDRDLSAMRKELIQIACACVRAARDICDEERGMV